MANDDRKEKFTPGKWRIRKIAELDLYKNASLCIMAHDDGIIGLGKNAETVVTMPNLHRYPEKKDTIWANAHLISCAPEMYELLHNITLDARYFDMDKVEAILKKARGEE